MCPWEEVSVVGSSLNETLDLFLCSYTHAQTHTHTQNLNKPFLSYFPPFTYSFNVFSY